MDAEQEVVKVVHSVAEMLGLIYVPGVGMYDSSGNQVAEAAGNRGFIHISSTANPINWLMVNASNCKVVDNEITKRDESWVTFERWRRISAYAAGAATF